MNFSWYISLVVVLKLRTHTIARTKVPHWTARLAELEAKSPYLWPSIQLQYLFHAFTRNILPVIFPPHSTENIPLSFPSQTTTILSANSDDYYWFLFRANPPLHCLYGKFIHVSIRLKLYYLKVSISQNRERTADSCDGLNVWNLNGAITNDCRYKKECNSEVCTDVRKIQ